MDIIKLKGATEAEWTAIDPILKEREPGLTLNTDNLPIKIKYGDGIHKWSELPYFEGSGGSTLTPTDQILEWDETSSSYKPYADRKTTDPGYPYAYIGTTEPARNNRLNFDADLYATYVRSTAAGAESGLSGAMIFGKVKSGYYPSFAMRAVKLTSSTGYVSFYGKNESGDSRFLVVYIGSYDNTGNHLKIDNYLDTVTFQLSHILFPKISAKTTPVDADSLLLIDSADSSRTKKLAWVNLKIALQAYFDPIYGLFGSDVYKEINIGGLHTFRAGTNDPTIYSAGGLLIPIFSNSVTNEVFFTIVLPGNYKNGTNIIPVVHWMPMTSPTYSYSVVWQLEYEWVNVDAELTGTPTLMQTFHMTGTTGFKHLNHVMLAVTGTGKTKGSALICRFFRDPSHATDQYDGAAGLISVGIKYQIDSVGSSS